MRRTLHVCHGMPIYLYTLPISMDIPGPNDLTILDRYLLLGGPSGGVRQPVHFSGVRLNQRYR